MNPNRHIRSATTVLGATFIGCLITALTACAAPGTPSGDTGASPEPPTAPTSHPATTNPAQSQLLTLAGRVTEYLRQTHPAQYAGVALDGAKLVVYRIPSTSLDASLAAKFPDAPLTLHDADHSARQLEALAGRITADIDHWNRQGVPITTVAPLVDGSAVEIGTTDVERATAELPERYGPAPLKFTEANPTLLSTTSPAG
ncbi:hypothetical protein GCM10009677_35210 [Sphaerisporangium rubeum]|uniref:Uncharacterized protein n=1 Tax=Sphaerisporangium rubeum TaxID=321317 RepID=A0A7X0IJC5_9ACTN|nr:hypothetical protein [Sphaerisporangium rubeum]MBB6476236.1 hypothetical protein [Sphaerisporangium rubeum]